MNPQFVIKLDDVDDNPDDGQEGCTVIVGLMQKNKRRRRKMGEDMETIGYAIYEVRGFSHILMSLFFYGLIFSKFIISSCTPVKLPRLLINRCFCRTIYMFKQKQTVLVSNLLLIIHSWN